MVIAETSWMSNLRLVDESMDKSKIWKLTEISEPAQCRSLRLIDNLRKSKWGMELIFFGKPTLSPSYSAVFGVLHMLLLCGSCYFGPVASLQAGCILDVDPVENSFSNMPLSRKYLIGYYIEKHNSLPGTKLHGLLASEYCFHDREGLALNISDVLGFSELHRHLIGEGSHRRLVTTMIFDVQSEVMSWFDAHFCQVVIIEHLPIGVFADPFEMQHLVQHQVYLDAAVFGDTNLELPSALSNRSIVEVHMDFEHANLSKCNKLVVELPLHARYPPLDGSGYSRVEMGAPDLFVRCRPKSSRHEDYYWTLASLNAEHGNNVSWLIPCGNKGHTGFVSIITFISALIFSLLLVLSVVYYSPNDDIKSS